jgi:transcriptional regulator with XRE-family HTH domain
MVLASRVHRLAELRKRQHTTQVQVAEAMGVTQARVSRIEKGQLERSEVDTLAAYVKALGGKLKISLTSVMRPTSLADRDRRVVAQVHAQAGG